MSSSIGMSALLFDQYPADWKPIFSIVVLNTTVSAFCILISVSCLNTFSNRAFFYIVGKMSFDAMLIRRFLMSICANDNESRFYIRFIEYFGA